MLYLLSIKKKTTNIQFTKINNTNSSSIRDNEMGGIVVITVIAADSIMVTVQAVLHSCKTYHVWSSYDDKVQFIRCKLKYKNCDYCTTSYNSEKTEIKNI